jgi:hypothetical protein
MATFDALLQRYFDFTKAEYPDIYKCMTLEHQAKPFTSMQRLVPFRAQIQERNEFLPPGKAGGPTVLVPQNTVEEDELRTCDAEMCLAESERILRRFREVLTDYPKIEDADLRSRTLGGMLSTLGKINCRGWGGLQANLRESISEVRQNVLAGVVGGMDLKSSFLQTLLCTTSYDYSPLLLFVDEFLHRIRASNFIEDKFESFPKVGSVTGALTYDDFRTAKMIVYAIGVAVDQHFFLQPLFKSSAESIRRIDNIAEAMNVDNISSSKRNKVTPSTDSSA